MAVIGPRPALWNQDDLIAERDKYHANDVRPGLTGWAQINGRAECIQWNPTSVHSGCHRSEESCGGSELGSK